MDFIRTIEEDDVVVVEDEDDPDCGTEVLVSELELTNLVGF